MRQQIHPHQSKEAIELMDFSECQILEVFRHEKLSELVPPERIPNLRKLVIDNPCDYAKYIDQCVFVDISYVSEYHGLEELTLDLLDLRNKINVPSSLRRMILISCDLDKFDFLEDLTNITHLVCSYCCIDTSEMRKMQGMRSLRYLKLRSGRKSLRGPRPLGHPSAGAEGLKDLSFLEGLPQLEVLDLEGNEITDLTPLANCPNLWYLNLGCNPLTNLHGLEFCSSLRLLIVSPLVSPGITSLVPLFDNHCIKCSLGYQRKLDEESEKFLKLHRASHDEYTIDPFV